MVLWGLVDGQDVAHRHKSVAQTLFGALPITVSFPAHRPYQSLLPLTILRYDVYDKVEQTFRVSDLLQHADLHFGVLVLQILTNWGDDSVCVHYIRVDGVQL